MVLPADIRVYACEVSTQFCTSVVLLHEFICDCRSYSIKRSSIGYDGATNLVNAEEFELLKAKLAFNVSR